MLENKEITMTIKDQIIALRKDLNLYNHHYYILDDPIRDYEFDRKLKQLEKLEENHPEFKDDNSPHLELVDSYKRLHSCSQS